MSRDLSSSPTLWPRVRQVLATQVAGNGSDDLPVVATLLRQGVSVTPASVSPRVFRSSSLRHSSTDPVCGGINYVMANSNARKDRVSKESTGTEPDTDHELFNTSKS